MYPNLNLRSHFSTCNSNHFKYLNMKNLKFWLFGLVALTVVLSVSMSNLETTETTIYMSTLDRDVTITNTSDWHLFGTVDGVNLYLSPRSSRTYNVSTSNPEVCLEADWVSGLPPNPPSATISLLVTRVIGSRRDLVCSGSTSAVLQVNGGRATGECFQVGCTYYPGGGGNKRRG